MSLIGSFSDVLGGVKQSPSITGDHDLFSHLVPEVEALLGLMEGSFVVALCGKRWVPSSMEPDKYPLCPTCRDIYEQFTS